MTVVDYAALAIVGLSVVISVWRGAVREVLALTAWFAAFVAAQAYASAAAAFLPTSVESPALRLLTGFAVVFVAVLLLTTLAAATISRLVRSAGLGPLDRTLGAIFGVARGMLVVIILVLLSGLTAFPRTPTWRDAMLSPLLEAAAASVKPMLPYELARRIDFD
jgi:membrane protein required for colicin V production